MKVLLLAPIHHDFPPVGYGPWELVVYNLADALIDLGIDVTVFATREAKTRAKLLYHLDKPIDEHSALKESTSMVHSAAAIETAKDFDIIHNNNNIGSVLLAKFAGTKMVTTLHGSAFETFRKPLHEYLKDENYVSISNAERDFAPYLNYVGNVYNGVDFTKYQLSDGNGKYLLFSGRITPEKGIEDALEFSQKTGIPLKIAGLITDEEYYNEKVKPHLGVQVEYLGNLAYPEYSDVLKNAKALLAFNHWNEPFGLTNIDSLASGVPIIGYDKGALKEIVFDPKMGVIAENMDEALKNLSLLNLGTPTEIRDLAARKFSREKMAKDYLEIYTMLVKT